MKMCLETTHTGAVYTLSLRKGLKGYKFIVDIRDENIFSVGTEKGKFSILDK